MFAELGIAEDDLVRANRQRQVADRRLAHALTFDPDLGPRHRVDRDRSGRPVHGDRRDLSGRHLHGADDAVAERLVDDLDLVAAGRNHDAVAQRRAEHLLVLEQLQLHRRLNAHPAGNRRALGRRDRHDERCGLARLDGHRLLDGSDVAFEHDRMLARRERIDEQRRLPFHGAVDRHLRACGFGPNLQLAERGNASRQLDVLRNLLSRRDGDRHRSRLAAVGAELHAVRTGIERERQRRHAARLTVHEQLRADRVRRHAERAGRGDGRWREEELSGGESAEREHDDGGRGDCRHRQRAARRFDLEFHVFPNSDLVHASVAE